VCAGGYPSVAMCGRFTLTFPDYEALARALGVEPDPDAAEIYRPRYNVAPTDPHWVLRVKNGKRELCLATWGLVNSWASDGSGGAKKINARAETLATSPAFKHAFEKRRCVVPADGFYEWTGKKGARRPIWFHPPEGGLLHLAGLYESWKDAEGSWHRTFTIVTTAANDTVRGAHDRMPVILAPEEVEEWMDPAAGKGPGGRKRLAGLLDAAPEGAIEGVAVSPRVNSVENDDPGVLEATGEALPVAEPLAEQLNMFGGGAPATAARGRGR
jgi:putative SOS response-associated peptidase YedK